MEINRTKVGAGLFFFWIKWKMLLIVSNSERKTFTIHDMTEIVFHSIWLYSYGEWWILCINDGFCIQNSCVWCGALIIIPKTIFWLWICMKCSLKKRTAHKKLMEPNPFIKKIKVFFISFELLGQFLNDSIFGFRNLFWLLSVVTCNKQCMITIFYSFWIIQNLEK